MPTINHDTPRQTPLKIISFIALLLALIHMFSSRLTIDFTTISLLIISILPWLFPLVKSLEFPGGLKLEFWEISKRLIEEKVTEEEKAKLARHQIVSSQTWDNGYYKLYSNGMLTQRFKTSIASGKGKTYVPFPISFPNEVTGIKIIGDSDARITDVNPSGIEITHPTQPNKELTILASGL